MPAHCRSIYFNPRSPWGERPASRSTPPENGYFNPRSPWGERPYSMVLCPACAKFQSTLPVGGATISEQSGNKTSSISIHAPRGGSDGSHGIDSLQADNFNPRSPWGERLPSATPSTPTGQFQSTLPVGGATSPIQSQYAFSMISIHAPRGGSDARASLDERPGVEFQSTLPVGGATRHRPCRSSGRKDFNPRSPWGERHVSCTPSWRLSRYFNPRSPWGERLVMIRAAARRVLFQSTLPVGGATVPGFFVF